MLWSTIICVLHGRSIPQLWKVRVSHTYYHTATWKEHVPQLVQIPLKLAQTAAVLEVRDRQ